MARRLSSDAAASASKALRSDAGSGMAVSRVRDARLCASVKCAWLLAKSLAIAAKGAIDLTQAPEIAPVADELARSAGFKDLNGDGVVRLHGSGHAEDVDAIGSQHFGEILGDHAGQVVTQRLHPTVELVELVFGTI